MSKIEKYVVKKESDFLNLAYQLRLNVTIAQLIGIGNDSVST